MRYGHGRRDRCGGAHEGSEVRRISRSRKSQGRGECADMSTAVPGLMSISSPTVILLSVTVCSDCGEPLQHGADIPVLEFDGRAAAVDPGPQAPVVLGLDVAASGEVGRKHREIVRDDEVVFFIRPGAGRHTARRTLAGKRVIGGAPRESEAVAAVHCSAGPQVPRCRCGLPAIRRLHRALGERAEDGGGRQVDTVRPIPAARKLCPSHEVV